MKRFNFKTLLAIILLLAIEMSMVMVVSAGVGTSPSIVPPPIGWW